MPRVPPSGRVDRKPTTMECLNVPVRPVSPPAAYQGGKRNLAGRLVKLIDAMPHRTYVDVFHGMGGVFLRRTRKPRVEVINDISGDVANLFRILQEHYPYFMDTLRWRLTSRAEFERLLSLPPDRLTDLNRAARFLYVQRLAFGGKVASRHFGVSRSTPARFDVTKLEPVLAELHERLAGVTIEQLGYAEVIRRYDAAETLFYLDPPYWGCEGDYGQDVFGRDDFEKLAAQLERISGRFILSINDTPGAREVFGRFIIAEAETTWTMATAAVGSGKRVTELIVSN